MTRIVTVCLALCLAANVAFGQCQPYQQGRVVYTQPTYVPTKTVVKEVVREVPVPIAVPVLVPATVFQYIPAIQPSVAVPVAAAPAAPVQTPQQPDIDALVKARVEAALRERSNPGDSGPPPLILPGELTAEQPKAQPAAQNDLNGQVANMLAGKSCVNCHTEGDKPVKGNVTLFVKKAAQMFFQPSVDRKKILDSVVPDKEGKPQMPPSGQSLAVGELDLLRRWEAQK
jgi:hypothetical protein